MGNFEITDNIFRAAVQALDTGDLTMLKALVAAHPRLLTQRTSLPGEGYFTDPYLLYFVADNPIRNNTLPANILEITAFLVNEIKATGSSNIQLQLDYTLGLVVTGRIPRECGVQIALMDVLIDAGAQPGGGLGALAHGNIDAANHLIERGGEIILASAVGLGRMDDINRLIPGASEEERLAALTVAAFYGKHDMVALLLGAGVNPNGYPQKDTGFHTHATPLHQAVYSGSLECVKLLVEAGASQHLPDKAYNGNALGWAMYMQTEDGYDDVAKKKFAVIEAYLKEHYRHE